MTAESRAAIQRLEQELRATEHEYRRVFDDVTNEEEQLTAINERLRSLKEDRRKYLDETLAERGATGELKLQNDYCPVCDRPLADCCLCRQSS